jgi:hypothetical protein
VPEISIYIDESGDLGSMKGSSFFTIAALIAKNRTRIERIPKRLRSRRLKKSIRRKPELKFHNSDDQTRKSILSMLVEEDDFFIATISIRKKSVRAELMRHREDFYEILLARLINLILPQLSQGSRIGLTIDPRRSGKIRDQTFDYRMRRKAEQQLKRLGWSHPSIGISRLDSQVSEGVQIADFIAGAIRRGYEMNDQTYSSIIAESIKIEELL